MRLAKHFTSFLFRNEFNKFNNVRFYLSYGIKITKRSHFWRENVKMCPVLRNITVGTQRAYFELKYFKIVKMRDAKYSLKMAAEKWRQKFPFLNVLYS